MKSSKMDKPLSVGRLLVAVTAVTTLLISVEAWAVEQSVNRNFKLNDAQYRAIVEPYTVAQTAAKNAVEQAEVLFSNVNGLQTSTDEAAQQEQVAAAVAAAQVFKQQVGVYIRNSEASSQAVREARKALGFDARDDQNIEKYRDSHLQDAADNWDARSSPANPMEDDLEASFAFWRDAGDGWNEASELEGGRVNVADFRSLKEMNDYLQRLELSRREGAMMLSSVDAVLAYLEGYSRNKQGEGIPVVDRGRLRELFASYRQHRDRLKEAWKKQATQSYDGNGRTKNPYR